MNITKSKQIFKITIIFILFIIQITALSCNLHRGTCITSCMLQNCATGYCQNNICICNRCDKGFFFK